MKNKDIFKKLVYLEGGSKKWQVANSKTGDSEKWLQHILPADAEAPNIENDRRKEPFLIIVGLSLLLIMVLAGKLFSLQLVHGQDSLKEAEGNRVREKVIRAPRGIIYDTRGTQLVKNIPNYDLSVTPSNLPFASKDREDEIKQLSTITGISVNDINDKIKKNGAHSPQPVLLMKNLDSDKSIILESKITTLPGVNVDVNPIREYLDGGLLSHVLGYVGRISGDELKKNQDYLLTDYIGKLGLEKSYERTLRGVMGKERVEVDSTGKNEKHLNTVDPIPGDNLKLSIDIELQKHLADALRVQMDKAKVQKASAVAINPQNGQILAMVNIPTYDDNVFAKGISQDDYSKLLNDPNSPLLNRAMSGEYPSGSTIKPFIASGAIEEGTITESTTVNSTGGIKVGDFFFPDWKAGGHGVVNVLSAIANSVNTFFYAIGGGYQNIQGLGPERIKSYLEKYGFGALTGIDISGESKGNIPDPEWKLRVFNQPWYLGDTYHMSIGQGDILVTPLQLANATAAIANGGTLFAPTFIQNVLDSNGGVKSSPAPKVLRNNVVKSSTLDVIQRGMRMTVTNGSGRLLNNLPKTVAAKTGTAQYGYNNEHSHAWFICYGPTEKPTIAMSILLEGAGGGDVYAAPVANEVLGWYFANR